MPPLPPRFLATGVPVNAVTLDDACARIIARARERAGGYVCFCDVNSLSCARRDPAHFRALEKAWLATPDGMPVVWLGKRLQPHPITRVYGPDVLLAVCSATSTTNLRHFFYGAAPGVAEKLAAQLADRFPGLQVAGCVSPPFRDLDDSEAAALKKRIQDARVDFLWVGLGTPKQERFMSTLGAQLDTGVTLGVGAAFDFLSGNIPQAPRWMQRSGLEWLFRLASEPRRLAPRYFRNNPLFLARALRDLLTSLVSKKK